MSVNKRLEQLSLASRGKKRKIVEIDGKRKIVEVDKDMTDKHIEAELEGQAPKRSIGSQLAETTAQRAAGAVRGLAAPFDAGVDALAGTMRLAGGGLANVGAGFYDLIGAPQLADRVRQNQRTFDTALSRPATVRSLTQQVVAPPTTTAGKIADFGAEMLGGAMMPKRLLPEFAQPQPKRASLPPQRPAAPPVKPPTPRQATQAVQQAIEQPADDVAALGREAVMRDARLRAAGVRNPTTGMVTRDPRAWNFEQELSKRYGAGDDILSQIKSAEDDLRNASRRLVERQGGTVGPETTGVRVSEALAKKSAEMQDEIGGLYRQIRAEKGDVNAGGLWNLREKLSAPEIVDDAAFDAARTSLNRRLQRLGLISKNGKWKRANVTVQQAEDLRKFIGKLNVPNTTPDQARFVRRTLTEALDDDVFTTVGDDAFKVARDAARARFEEFSKTFAGKLAETEKPEQISNQILRQGTGLDDLRSLTQSLTTGTPEQVARGEKALQNLRAQAIDDVISPNISPDGQVRGASMYNNFMKKADVLRTILPPEDYKALRRFANASRDALADVPRSYVNYSNTASAMGNTLFPGVVPKKPGLLGSVVRRAAGLAGGGPAGYAAVDTGEMIAKEVAQRKMAEDLARQVAVAQNPRVAAAATQNMRPPAAPPSLDLASVLDQYLQRGAAATSPRAGSLLAEDLFLPLAAEDDRERKKKKKKR